MGKFVKNDAGNWVFDGIDSKNVSNEIPITVNANIPLTVSMPEDLNTKIYDDREQKEKLSEKNMDSVATLQCNIKIRYISDDAPRLKSIEKGDWIDVYSYEDVEIKKDTYQNISLGFAMELPEGYEAHLAPRSSTLKKFGILCGNSFGIIDNSYAGDNDIWGFVAYAVRDTIIHKGDRIAQFRIMEKQPKINFIEVDHLEKEDRGGFGSTGNGVL